VLNKPQAGETDNRTSTGPDQTWEPENVRALVFGTIGENRMAAPEAGAMVNAFSERDVARASWLRAMMVPGHPTPFTPDLTQPMEGRP